MCSAQKRFRCETVVLRFKLKSAESQLEKVEEANDQKLRTIKSFYRERPPAKFFWSLSHTISWYCGNFHSTQPFHFYLAADATLVLSSGHKIYLAPKNELAL